MEPASAMLARWGLKPKKPWGQNFVSDESVLGRIAAACRVSTDHVVVELGAGLGHLTRALAATGATVVAVERDRDLVKVLEKELRLPNVRIVAANAAEANFAELSGAPRSVVAGNLPYQIAKRILVAVCEQRSSVERAVVTIQREVADRVTAQPGCRDYGIPSVLLQAAGRVERLFDLAAGAFFPRPKVDSVVVRFEPFSGSDALSIEMIVLERVVKAAFASRRKILSNSLGAAGRWPRGVVERALTNSGIGSGRRAETLSPREFVGLARALEDCAGASP